MPSQRYDGQQVYCAMIAKLLPTFHYEEGKNNRAMQLYSVVASRCPAICCSFQIINKLNGPHLDELILKVGNRKRKYWCWLPYLLMQLSACHHHCCKIIRGNSQDKQQHFIPTQEDANDRICLKSGEEEDQNSQWRNVWYIDITENLSKSEAF